MVNTNKWVEFSWLKEQLLLPDYDGRTLIVEDGVVLMQLNFSDNWEISDLDKQVMNMYDYLQISESERRHIEVAMKPFWYVLLWERLIWDIHPSYFIRFHDSNKKLFIGTTEKTMPRYGVNWENKELIFVNLNLSTPEVNRDIISFKEIFKRILAEIANWK